MATMGEGEKIRLPDFAHLVQTFTAQALINLGHIPNPISRKSEVNLEMARYSITVLEVLEEKTRGNLSADEENLLRSSLFNVRLAFTQEVEKQKSRGNDEKKEDEKKV